MFVVCCITYPNTSWSHRIGWKLLSLKHLCQEISSATNVALFRRISNVARQQGWPIDLFSVICGYFQVILLLLFAKLSSHKITWRYLQIIVNEWIIIPCKISKNIVLAYVVQQLARTFIEYTLTNWLKLLKFFGHFELKLVQLFPDQVPPTCMACKMVKRCVEAGRRWSWFKPFLDRSYYAVLTITRIYSHSQVHAHRIRSASHQTTSQV